MLGTCFDRGLSREGIGGNQGQEQEKAAKHEVSELLIHDDMGVVGARAGDTGKSRISIRN
jgi:hypothetical protein